MTRHGCVTLVGLAAAAFAASAAGALEDLTGTWLGKVTCDVVTSVEHEKTKSNVTFVIDDDPSGNAFVVLDTVTYHVTVLEDPDAPSKGRVGGMDCNANAEFGGQVLALTVKAKDGSDQGSMSGELVFTRTDASPRFAVCKMKLKRETTSIETPITACPL